MIKDEITPQNFVAEEFVRHWCIKIMPKENFLLFFVAIIAHYFTFWSQIRGVNFLRLSEMYEINKKQFAC